MGNAKMWFGLVKQMIYEILILFLLYLFVGNNFGNNIFSSNWVEDYYRSSILNSIETSSCLYGLLQMLSNVIFLLRPIVYLLNIIFAFASFWMTILLFCFLRRDGIINSYTKAFGGQYPADAAPKIEKWYKQSRAMRIIFTIIIRIIFVSFIVIKGINAPKDYTANFFLFKWNMGGSFMGILIIIVGVSIALFSTFKVFKEHHFNMKELCKHTCPNCHKLAWVKKKYKNQVGFATYDDGHEHSSGYYSREVVGEVVDSAGNHVGDVEGDVWVDTSTTHYKQLTPDVFKIIEVYAPCGCEVKIGTIEKKL